MRQKLLWIVVCLAMLAVIAAVHPSSASAQESPNACAVPDALLEAGEKEEARKAYVALLRREPATTCATEGLKVINAPQPVPQPPSCDAADEQFDTGDLEAARIAYEEVGEDSECAATGLAAVREVRRLCDQGDAHLALDRKDDALAAFKSALEKNPKASCAKDGLEQVGPGLLARVSDAIPEFLIAIGLLLLCLSLLLLLGHVRPVYGVFSGLPIVGQILRPRLTLAALDDTALQPNQVGAPMAAEVRGGRGP